MDTVELGLSQVSVSRVVFGAMARRNAHDRSAQLSTLRAALDAGVTAVDTAPLYDFGGSERIVGEVIRERSTKVTVLTKVGLRWDDSHGDVLFRGRGSDGRERTVRRDSRPQAVRRDVEESLRRLGVETLDAVQVHQHDRHTPVADTVGELERLRDEGKLRAIGVCNYSASQVKQAQQELSDVSLASHQLPYSLLQRNAEHELLPLCRSEAIAVLAYSPLAAGRLSGGPARDRDNRAIARAFSELQPIAQQHALSPPQLALAWLLAQPGVSAVLVGANRPSQARDNAHAARARLSDLELDAVRHAFAHLGDHARGPRRIRRVLRRIRALWPQ